MRLFVRISFASPRESRDTSCFRPRVAAQHRFPSYGIPMQSAMFSPAHPMPLSRGTRQDAERVGSAGRIWTVTSCGSAYQWSIVGLGLGLGLGFGYVYCFNCPGENDIMRIYHVIKTDQCRSAPKIRPTPHFVVSPFSLITLIRTEQDDLGLRVILRNSPLSCCHSVIYFNDKQ